MTLEPLLGGLAAASLDTGGHLSPGEARRLACRAGIIPAVLDGASQVLDLGRERRFHTEPQRIALAHRDRGCTAEGCDAPPGLCHAHHDQPWSRGGTTDTTTGRLLCPRHHTLAHDPRYTDQPGRPRQAQVHHDGRRPTPSTRSTRGLADGGGVPDLTQELGPALHTHVREDEVWYVLEGDFRFKAGAEMFWVSTGGLAFGPRGTPHNFQNVGDEPGRLLVITAPSGAERLFEDYAALLPGPVGPEMLEAVARANWVDFVGPPLEVSDPALGDRRLHQLDNLLLHRRAPLLERVRRRPQVAVVEVRRVLEAERRVPVAELAGVLEEDDDLAVLVRVGGHAVPGLRRQLGGVRGHRHVHPLGERAVRPVPSSRSRPGPPAGRRPSWRPSCPRRAARRRAPSSRHAPRR